MAKRLRALTALTFLQNAARYFNLVDKPLKTLFSRCAHRNIELIDARGKKGGLREYARAVGKAQSTLSELKSAATVYKLIAQAIGFVTASHLTKP